MTAQTLARPAVAVCCVPDAPVGRTLGLLVVLFMGLVVLGAGAAIVVLFGSRTVDAGSVAAEVERLTHEQVGVAASGVTCPVDVPVEVGATFRCSATVDGQEIGYTVRQYDGQGGVTIASAGFVALARVEATLVEQLRDGAGFAATADCGPASLRVVVGGPGTTIDCTVASVADPSDAARVVGTVTDDQGTVSFASGS